jgi:pimeloyl-ACP methyl ester carboxylesterase
MCCEVAEIREAPAQRERCDRGCIVRLVLRRPPNPQILAERLRRLEGEIMVINGGLDRIASPDDAFIAALPAAALVRLPDVDHVSLPGNAAFRRAAIAS